MKKGLLLAALFAASHATLAAEGLTLGAGIDYTTGKFGGTESTDTLYVPFYAKYETGRWLLGLTIPYIRITGPGNVIGAGDNRVVVPGGAAARTTESGLGDIIARAFYNVLNENTSVIGLDVGTKIKFGTADEKRGLGTGQNDYSLQADVFKPIDAFTAFGSLGYRWYGDPPGVNLKNVFYWSVGGTYKVLSNLSAGAAYDYRPAIIPGGGEISELTLFLSRRYDRVTKLQPYVVLGFGKASPDYGAGVQVNYSF